MAGGGLAGRAHPDRASSGRGPRGPDRGAGAGRRPEPRDRHPVRQSPGRADRKLFQGARRRAAPRGPRPPGVRHLPGWPNGLRLRRESDGIPLRRAPLPPRGRREPQLGWHLGSRDRRHPDRLVGRDPDSHQDPGVSPGERPLAVQRSTPDPGHPGDRPLGRAPAGLAFRADGSCGGADRTPGVRSRPRRRGPSDAPDQRRSPDADRGFGKEAGREPGPVQAIRRESSERADRQHRFRRNRGGHPPHQPHAVPVVLSGEANLLSRGRRPFRFWSGPGERPGSLLHPAGRIDGGEYR